MKRTSSILIIACLYASILSPANAALLTIGTATYAESEYKLIYDDDDQLTWLDYSNSGATYPESLDWVATLNNPDELTINLNEGYTASWDSTEWRLAGNATGVVNYYTRLVYTSEMEDLYYNELGNILDDTELNYGDFDNLFDAYYHMSADAALAGQLGLSWSPRFLFFSGVQEIGSNSVNGGIYGMAVHPGAVVPEPVTLSILGLGGLALLRKRKV